MENREKNSDFQAIMAKYAALKDENLALKDRIKFLEKQLFGPKSEQVKTSVNPQQTQLFEEQETEAPAEPAKTTQVTTHQRKKRKPEQNRQPLPAHLERVEEYIEPDFDTSGMIKIGEDRTEILEKIPARLIVRVLIRPKYVKEEKIMSPSLPALPIPQGNAGPSFIGYVLMAKYLMHLPLYRLSKQFAREGYRIADSTLGDWIARAIDRFLVIIYERLKSIAIIQQYLQADETPIKVLDTAKKQRCHIGQYWVYNDPVNDIVFFDYQKGRGREGPKGILTNFKGYLQSDGYQAYDLFAGQDYPHITVFYCMAHARRKFHDALSNDEARAQHALNLMGQLYKLEKALRNRKKQYAKQQWHELRKRVRQRYAKTILEQLHEWLLEQARQVLPQSLIGKAVAYTLRRIKGLSLYIQDGSLEIDNNLVENQIRPVALGKKNYLFAGSHQAAQRAAIIYTLIGTCEKVGINPEKWLTDVLAKLPARMANDIDDLLPQNWNPEKAWSIEQLFAKK